MKNKFIYAVVIVFVVACSNAGVHFGKKPLQLSGFDFDLNIPEFFNDEKVFEGNAADLFVEVEEGFINSDDGKEVNYVIYSQRSAKDGIKVLKYGSTGFSKMVLCSDLADKEVFLVEGKEEGMTPKDIDRLVAKLKSDLGDPIPYNQLENPDSYVSYEWHKENKVVKLVLDMGANIAYGEEPPADWQQTRYREEEEIEAKISIVTVEFYKALREIQ